MNSRSGGTKWLLAHALVHLPQPSHTARSMTITQRRPGTPRRTSSEVGLVPAPLSADDTTNSPSAVSVNVAGAFAASTVSPALSELVAPTPATMPPAATKPARKNSRRCIVIGLRSPPSESCRGGT